MRVKKFSSILCMNGIEFLTTSIIWCVFFFLSDGCLESNTWFWTFGLYEEDNKLIHLFNAHNQVKI